jgi:hypothetical protein
LIWIYFSRQEKTLEIRCLFTPATGVFLLLMLYFTNSRAAVLAFGAALLVFLFLLKLPRKGRVAFYIAVPLLTAAGMLAVNLGRGLGSMEVRFDYFAAAWRMFLGHPWLGTGWGDFFHEYTVLKSVLSDESPHTPHNLILAFASQTGFCGLVTSVFALTIPFLFLARRTWRIPLTQVFQFPAPMIFLGWTAWSIHSMSDINLQIPGSVATALTLVIIGCGGSADGSLDEKSERAKRLPSWCGWTLLWGFLILAAATFAGGVKLTRFEIRYNNLQSYCDPRFKTREEFQTLSVSRMMELLNACEQLAPTSPFPPATAADFCMMKGRPYQAERLFKEVLERSPERSSFHYKLHLVQRHIGKDGEAAKHLRKAIELFPNHPRYNPKSTKGAPLKQDDK